MILNYADDYYSTLEEKGTSLTREEFLSLYYYTCEWSTKEKCIHYMLNASLISSSRDNARKWRFYLHHFFSGFCKLPLWSGAQDLYRGVGIDVVKRYPESYVKDNKITWYSCTSTSADVSVITECLSSINGPRTLFTINGVFSGRLSSSVSVNRKDEEILLPPGSRFLVVSVARLENTVMVQLRQIPTLEKSLNLEKVPQN